MTIQDFIVRREERTRQMLFVRDHFDDMRRARERVCNQREMAHICGVPQAYISWVESGLYNRIGKERLTKIVLTYQELMESTECSQTCSSTPQQSPEG